jgi:hypothetical protein
VLKENYQQQHLFGFDDCDGGGGGGGVVASQGKHVTPSVAARIN